jgi:PAS domain S-box-containing protein
MTSGYADDELADLSAMLGGMLRSVATRWRVRVQAGRLGSHSLENCVRLVDCLERAAGLVESGGLEGHGHDPDATAVESEERFRLLVDGILDYAIFMLDPDGRVVSWNGGAERIKGYRAEEIVGQHFSSFYAHEDVASGKPGRELEIAARDGRYAEEGWRVRKDGGRFWASVTITALRNSRGQLQGFGKVTRDLTELRAATEEARRSEERLRLMIEAVQDYAIFMLDPDGRIVSWNVGAERLKGYRAEEIIGGHFSIFYSEEDRRRGHPADELRRATADGRYEEEGWRYRKDGSRFWANVVITALFDQDRRLLGFTKVTRDFTEARRLREAQLGMQVRDDFISMASHELRTPLTALLMHLESLRRTVRGDDSAPRLRERLDKAWLSGERLSRLMNEMLDISRISGGRLVLEPEPVVLGEIVREVAERFDDKSVITLRIEPQLRGVWDRSRIDQVLTNLIANAVKYGAGKPIEVEAETSEEEAIIRVIDHGIGIPADKLQKIFEPFERAVANRDYDGFGLGLWIARQFVESSGGRIGVTSRPGEGATFTVRLPLVPREEPSENKSETHAAR